MVATITMDGSIDLRILESGRGKDCFYVVDAEKESFGVGGGQYHIPLGCIDKQP